MPIQVFSKRQITIEQEIGNGSYSHVFTGTYKKGDGTTKAVALKAYAVDAPEEYKIIAKEEMKAYETLKHENIIEFYGLLLVQGSWPMFQPGQKICLVFELMQFALDRFLEENNDNDLRIQHWILLSIARGIAYLHNQGFIHGDIKAGNILISQDPAKLALPKVKICDLGTIGKISDLPFTAGTTPYMAPELFSTRGACSLKTDVYSAGILFWTVLSNHPEEPYSGRIPSIPKAAAIMDEDYSEDFNYEKVIKYQVSQGKRPSDFTDIKIGEPYQTIIIQCWDQNPNNRPDMVDIARELDTTFRRFPLP